MSVNQIRVGVVGVGSFGQHHVRHLACHDLVTLVGVSDLDRALTARIAERFGCAAFARAEDLEKAVDAAVVAVPATAHHEIVGPFLDAGVHVLVEKPMASDVAAARDLIGRAARSGALLQVGLLERFSPAIRKLTETATAARRIACVRRSPWDGRSGDVDVVLDMMIHDIDHACVLAAAPVLSVAASGAVGRSGHVDEAEAWLTFRNGVVATLSASRGAEEPERHLTVTEPDRVFLAELSEPSLTVGGRRSGGTSEKILREDNDNLGDELASFVDSVAGGAPVAVDGQAGLAALEIAARIQAAMSEQQEPVSEFATS